MVVMDLPLDEGFAMRKARSNDAVYEDWKSFMELRKKLKE